MKRLVYLSALVFLMVGTKSWSGEIGLNDLFASQKAGGHVAGLKYGDDKSTEFLKRVLDALNRQYAIEYKSGEITVYWVPESEEQQQEVQNRVSQYDFIREVCPTLKLPLPSDRAKAELHC